MTPDGIATLIIALVGMGGFFLSMRSTSYTELKALFEQLKKDFADYKETSKKDFAEYKKEAEERVLRDEKHIALLQASNDAKDKQIEELEDINRTVVNQNDNFKRYIVRLIRQLEAAKIVPEKMDDIE